MLKPEFSEATNSTTVAASRFAILVARKEAGPAVLQQGGPLLAMQPNRSRVDGSMPTHSQLVTKLVSVVACSSRCTRSDESINSLK